MTVIEINKEIDKIVKNETYMLNFEFGGAYDEILNLLEENEELQNLADQKFWETLYPKK